MDRKTAAALVASWAAVNIETRDQEAFRDVAETELLGLHGGEFCALPDPAGGVRRV